MSLYKRALTEAGMVAAALALGLAVGAFIAREFGAPPLSVIRDMMVSARVLPDMVAEYTAVLALTAAAFAIPLHAGLFNIGAEGSLYAGALVALWVGIKTGSLIAAIAAGTLAGLAITGLAGLLRVRLGVNEVLSTIMLNWIVYWILLYVVVTKLADPIYTQRTVRVPETARIPWVTVGGYPVPGTILVSIAVLTALWVFLRMTRYGLLLRVSGANEESAKARGVPVEVYRLGSMVIAGALAGLAGAIHITGFSYSIDVLGGTVRGYGFNGIGVALMGRNDPLAIIAASLLFSSMLAGSQVVEPRYGVPKEAADLMIGVIVVLLSAPVIFRIVAQRLRR